jgi:hypothetical protein
MMNTVFKVIVAAALTGIGAPSVWAGGPRELSFDDAIDVATKQAAAKIDAGAYSAVIKFDTASIIPNDKTLQDYAIKRITSGLINQDRPVLDRDSANENMLKNIRDYEVSGSVSDDEMVRLGKELGVRVVVFGSLSTAGGAYLLELNALNIETRILLVKSLVDVKKNDKKIHGIIDPLRKQQEKEKADNAKRAKERKLREVFADRRKFWGLGSSLGVNTAQTPSVYADIHGTAINHTFLVGYFYRFGSFDE